MYFAAVFKIVFKWTTPFVDIRFRRFDPVAVIIYSLFETRKIYRRRWCIIEPNKWIFRSSYVFVVVYTHVADNENIERRLINFIIIIEDFTKTGYAR